MNARPLLCRSTSWALATLLALASAACALVSHYDSTSYQNATNLKAEALFLIERAVNPPAAHAAAIDSLRLKLRQAYEYERGKGDPNRITVEQWKRLADPDGALLGGFIKKWRSDNRGQSPAFLDGVAQNVTEAFDQIIRLERAKVRD